jgi:hypothetical protein
VRFGKALSPFPQVVSTDVGPSIPASGSKLLDLSKRFQVRRRSEAFSLTMMRFIRSAHRG